MDLHGPDGELPGNHPRPDGVVPPSMQDAAEEYRGNDLVTITMTRNQAALIVYSLMEQSKVVPMSEQIEWTRLALGINDLIAPPNDSMEERNETESG